jgi:hypothetical protein
MIIPETEAQRASIFVDKFDAGTSYIYVGFKTSLIGDFVVNVSTTASNKNQVQYASLVATPTELAKIIAGTTGEMGNPGDVVDGNAGSTSASGSGQTILQKLQAFWCWSDSYLYSPFDPTFYRGIPFFANPNNPPAIGESPQNAPEKWTCPVSGGSGEGGVNDENGGNHWDWSMGGTIISEGELAPGDEWIIPVPVDGMYDLLSNLFEIKLDNLTGIVVERGIYNATAKRLEC